MERIRLEAQMEIKRERQLELERELLQSRNHVRTPSHHCLIAKTTLVLFPYAFGGDGGGGTIGELNYLSLNPSSRIYVSQRTQNTVVSNPRGCSLIISYFISFAGERCPSLSQQALLDRKNP